MALVVVQCLLSSIFSGPNSKDCGKFQVRFGDELRTDKHSIEDLVNQCGGPEAVAAVITWLVSDLD